MSKIYTSSEPFQYSQKRIIKSHRTINNLPKVQRKVVTKSNDKIITTTKNRKILISESSSSISGKGKKIPLNTIPLPKYHRIYSQKKISQPEALNQENDDDVQKNNIKKISKDNNNINNINENVIYNSNEYNNNDYYVSKNRPKTIDNNRDYNKESIVYDSCSYDVKRTVKKRYEYDSPERSSRIFVKSILCSPISVSYTEIDRPMLKKTYNLYKEEIEETEITIKKKMRKIWRNEIKCTPECSLTYIGEDNNKEYLIEEYEKKIEELNNTIYTLKKTKNSLTQQIEELQYSLNNKEFLNLGSQSFYFNFIKDNKKKDESWNKIVRKEYINSVNIYKKINNTKKKPLLIKNIDKIGIFGKEKQENLIDYGTYLSILSENTADKMKENIIIFGEEVAIPGIDKFKNIKHNLKGFSILSKKKPKNIIQRIDKFGIIPNIKLKSKPKPKPKNVIQKKDNIFIPPKKKELFTWDTFYGQELYILAKKKKKIYTISFLDGVEILKTPKPKQKNEIEFNDIIEIFPEPKDKPKIFEYDENYYIFIPGIEKPANIIEEIDSIELLPEIKEPIELLNEKCDIINIFGLDKPKNEKQSLKGFDIFRTAKPINIIEEQINSLSIESTPKKWLLVVEFGDEIFVEEEDRPIYKKQRTQELKILKKPKMKNIKQKTADFQISKKFKLKSIKPKNIIQKKDNINIYPDKNTNKNNNILEIYYGDELFIEKILKPENKIQRLTGFDFLKQLKPQNEIQIIEEIEIIPQPKKPLQLIHQNNDLFTINTIQLEKNKKKNNIYK